MLEVKSSPEGLAYLNIGCGNYFFPEWNNLDIHARTNVDAWDVRKPLPYPDNTFDAVYSSHLVEHLTPSQAGNLIREVCRALKPNGICRIVVPDLEELCKEYLAALDEAVKEPSERNIRRYKWTTIELMDQMVRERSGGLILQGLLEGCFEEDHLRERMGDELDSIVGKALQQDLPAEKIGLVTKVWSRAKVTARNVLNRWAHLNWKSDPRRSGESHKWMYDRLSLRLLVEEAGFIGFSITSYADSRIPHWDKYNLDRSALGDYRRKPDSIYVECQKRGDSTEQNEL